jgi:hypothetical protein
MHHLTLMEEENEAENGASVKTAKFKVLDVRDNLGEIRSQMKDKYGLGFSGRFLTRDVV